MWIGRRNWRKASWRARAPNLHRNDIDAAIGLITPSLAGYRNESWQFPGTRAHRSLVLLAAQADTLLGQAAAKRNDAAQAHDCWVHARDRIAPIARTGSDPNFLAAWAGALLLLDDTANAQPVIEELAATGYRTPDFIALVESKKLAYPDNVQVSQRIAAAMK